MYLLKLFCCIHCLVYNSLLNLYVFQSKIISELQNNGIHIYQFPTDDETVSDINVTMNTLVPFAVVGSNEYCRVGNKLVRSRQYPWGTVQGKDGFYLYL